MGLYRRTGNNGNFYFIFLVRAFAILNCDEFVRRGRARRARGNRGTLINSHKQMIFLSRDGNPKKGIVIFWSVIFLWRRWTSENHKFLFPPTINHTTANSRRRPEMKLKRSSFPRREVNQINSNTVWLWTGESKPKVYLTHFHCFKCFFTIVVTLQSILPSSDMMSYPYCNHGVTSNVNKKI